MFVYLSKKIAIPNNIPVTTVSWNHNQGWIAVGGANGLLKIIQLEDPKAKKKGASLTMNQTLEGHRHDVKVVTWNENFRKVTTSDSHGAIIVWRLHKGIWFEEMINNRLKSVVVDMKWTSDGQKICIAYEDGAVIVGSVGGDRLWGKELEDIELARVAWSPDSSHILFGTRSGQVAIYDHAGTYLKRLPLYATSGSENAKIIGLEWYDGAEGYMTTGAPSLALCYDNGRCQIMRNETDEDPVLIDMEMRPRCIKWNRNGSILAVCGTKQFTSSTNDIRQTHLVQFYDAFGKHLHTLRVPGSGISALTWEGSGLRIALSVDSSIYFANIRQDYHWGYFNHSLVYSFVKPDRVENCVVFWNTSTSERYVKYVKKLIALRAAGTHCVFATRTDDSSGQYILILCNEIGVPVDSKYIDVEPTHLTMTSTHIIAASNDLLYSWQYATSGNKLSGRDGKEQVFHIDETPSSAGPGLMKGASTTHTNDPIVAITASKNVLVVARTSGTLMRYNLPAITLEHKYVVRCRPQMIALNSNSKRLSIIDINGILTLFDFHSSGSNSGKQLNFQRKDAWAMLWSEDNPELFCAMEKTRMYVFRGTDPEEPVMSAGYLCSFSQLEIKAVLLDDVMANPEEPDKDMFVNFQTKSLRDTQTLLDTTPIREAFQFVTDNPHPRLWRLLAETALEQLNFDIADKAFVSCHDYQGIQLVKRLKLMADRTRQKAEIAAYFKHFDVAEDLYLSIGAKESALNLRRRLGDWFRVEQLLRESETPDRQQLVEAYKHIGDYYADRQKWPKAFKYYEKAQYLKGMVKCAYIVDDYTSLRHLVTQIPDGSEFLKDLGDKFTSVGLCEEAVMAYEKAGETKQAIETCVLLNQWDLAVRKAEEHKFPQIEGLLTKYASEMTQKQMPFQAAELYRKANKSTEAAKILANLATQMGDVKNNPVRAKQLYVLAALEINRFRAKLLKPGAGRTGMQSTVQQTIQTLLTSDASESAEIESPWRGVEAFHFLILAQRQMYANDHFSAMCTSIRLSEYDDILDPVVVYSLIALSSFHSKFYGQCSKAFIKLEHLTSITAEKREKYKKLALSIFSRHKPNDPQWKTYRCPTPKCGNSVFEWSYFCDKCTKPLSACTVTGRTILVDPVVSRKNVYSCPSCHHYAYTREIRAFTNCPMCHAELM